MQITIILSIHMGMKMLMHDESGGLSDSGPEHL